MTARSDPITPLKRLALGGGFVVASQVIAKQARPLYILRCSVQQTVSREDLVNRAGRD